MGHVVVFVSILYDFRRFWQDNLRSYFNVSLVITTVVTDGKKEKSLLL